jgi:hypothetical protein
VLGRRKSRLGRWADCAREEKEKGRWLGGLRAERDVGPAGRKEREREKVFFFLNSFQIRFSNFQTSNKQKSMHSNHDVQTLIISKLF